MKTYTVRMAVLMATAAIMMTGSAFAGQTQVEREMARRAGADPESAVGLLIRPAMETGTLSVGDAKQLKSKDGARSEVSTVEIGGLVYRIGIDTGP